MRAPRLTEMTVGILRPDPLSVDDIDAVQLRVHTQANF